MSRISWSEARTLFERVVDLPADARAEILEFECADPSLRKRVLAMLAADARDGATVLDGNPARLASLVSSGAPSLRGRRIGPYTIVDILGQGGMGIVCLAERSDVGKRVALKLVAGGIASPDRVARFLHERRVLAQLEHPNIARLLDAGVADDGMPWLTMEYVPGQSIDVYCDGERLTIEQRLELFWQVADAVAYAHRHLIVHRDLKPANILVGPDGTPRLLDFGIAKLLGPTSEDAPVTIAGMGPMTPQYASPEQLRGGSITTASDVYQLGALLFELLAGRAPHPSRLTTADARNLEQVARPSDAARTARPAAHRDAAVGPPRSEEIAKLRRATPESLRRRLTGDLDTIVRKATELDPANRYATAAELAADVRRHLDEQPIVARPATAWYRTRKFIVRHRAATATAALVAVGLIGFALAMAEQARRVDAQRARAEQVSTLLSDLFRSADPVVAQSESVTVASILDSGSARIQYDATLDPLVRGRLLMVIAESYGNLGRKQEGYRLQREALANFGHLPRDDSIRLRATKFLAEYAFEVNDLVTADAMADSALEVARTLPDERRLERAAILGAAGFVQSGRDDTLARRLMSAAYGIYERTPTRSVDDFESLLVNLGYLSVRQFDFANAEGYFRQALDLRRDRLGPQHTLAAKTMFDLAGALVWVGRIDEADSLTHEGLTVQRRVFSRPNTTLMRGLSVASRVSAAKGDFIEAENLAREALAVSRALYGDTAWMPVLKANLAGYVQRQGRFDEAVELHREALAAYEDESGTVEPEAAVVMTNLAYTEYQRGRPAVAESLYRQAVPILDSAWQGSSRIAQILMDFGVVLKAVDRCEEAESILRRSRALFLREYDPGHGLVLGPQRVLGACLTKLERYAEAESLLVDTFEKTSHAFGIEHVYTRLTAADLVTLYERVGDQDSVRRYRSVLASR